MYYAIHSSMNGIIVCSKG